MTASHNHKSTKPFLTSVQAALCLQVRTRTMDVWQRQKAGPCFTCIGGERRYRQADLDAFIEEDSNELIMQRQEKELEDYEEARHKAQEEYDEKAQEEYDEQQRIAADERKEMEMEKRKERNAERRLRRAMR